MCVSGRLPAAFWHQCWAEGSDAGCQCDADQPRAQEITNATLRGCKCQSAFISLRLYAFIFISSGSSVSLWNVINDEWRIRFDHHVTLTDGGILRAVQQTAFFFFCLSLQICDEIIVLHLGYLNYTRYQVMVSFKGLENITYEIKVKFVVSEEHWQDSFSAHKLIWDVCILVVALDFMSSRVRHSLLTLLDSLPLFSLKFLLSGKRTIPPSRKWRSGSGLSLLCWPLWWR